MQLYASLDLTDSYYCFIKQHSEDNYTWSFWSNSTLIPMDMTVSRYASSGESTNNLITVMREEGYPTFPIPSVHHTYEDLYTLYLQHKETNPELYI